MAGRGRPKLFKKEFIEQAERLSLLGLTNDKMADYFGVNRDTFYNWLKDYPDFSDAIKKGKEIADAKVVKSLYERALGYEHPEDKIFLDNGTPIIVPTTKHYPPDPTAAIFWLKNRQPANWRDKQEVVNTEQLSSDDIDFDAMTKEDRDKFIELNRKYQKKSE